MKWIQKKSFLLPHISFNKKSLLLLLGYATGTLLLFWLVLNKSFETQELELYRTAIEKSQLNILSDLQNNYWNYSSGTTWGSYLFVLLAANFADQTFWVGLVLGSSIASLLLVYLLYWNIKVITQLPQRTALVFAISYIALLLMFCNGILFTAHLHLLISLVMTLVVMYCTTHNLPDLSFNFFQTQIVVGASLLSVVLCSMSLYFFVVVPYLILTILINHKSRVKTAFRYLIYSISCLLFLLSIYKLNDVEVWDVIKKNLITLNTISTEFTFTTLVEEKLNYIPTICIAVLLLQSIVYMATKSYNIKMIHYVLLLLWLSFLLKTESIWVDRSVIIHVLLISVPILGAMVFMCIEALNLLLFKVDKKRTITVKTRSISVIFLLAFAIHSYSISHKQTANRSNMQKSLMYVYSYIYQNYLSFTYAIVDHNSNRQYNQKSSYFIPKTDFIETYTERSKWFRKYKNDNTLNQHPNLILPNSVFVIYYHKNNYETTERQTKEILNQLRQENIPQRIIYSDDYIDVVEIVNAEYSSKISELMFK